MLRVEDADVTEPELLDRWYTSHSYWVLYNILLTVVFDGIGSHWMFFIMRFYCTAHPQDLPLYKQSVVLDRVTEPSSFPVGPQPLPVYKTLAISYPLFWAKSLHSQKISWIIYRSTQSPCFPKSPYLNLTLK